LLTKRGSFGFVKAAIAVGVELLGQCLTTFTHLSMTRANVIHGGGQLVFIDFAILIGVVLLKYMRRGQVAGASAKPATESASLFRAEHVEERAEMICRDCLRFTLLRRDLGNECSDMLQIRRLSFERCSE